MGFMQVRFRLVFVGFMLAATVATAQGPVYRVAGRVVDALSGSPVGHAAVAIEPVEENGGGRRQTAAWGRQPQAMAGTTTGADGRFAFTGVAAGRYRLSAARRGYLAGNLDQHGDFFAAVIAGPNQPEAERIVFPLPPTATIEGTVLDSSGDPVSAASVTLFMQAPDGTAGMRQVRSASLQPGGNSYLFNGLAPGTYSLAATASPWFAVGGSPGFSAGPLDVAYGVTFYPNGASAAGAQPIAVKAGDTAEADFALNAVLAMHLAVPVEPGTMPSVLSVPAFNSSVPVGIGVGMRRQEPGQEPVTTINYSIAPGNYTLGTGAGAAAVNVAADTTLPGAAGPEPVAVTGRLAMADGGALPAGLTLRLVPGAFGGSAGRFFGGGRFWERPVEAAVGADGSFRAAAVPPGEYRIAAAATAGGPLVLAGAAARGGEISDTLELHVGADPVMLAATFAAANGSISSRVVRTDGAPAMGVMVLLVPRDGSQTGLYRQEESDSDGTWTLRGVAAGAYTVVAIQDGWDLAWRTPAVVAGYLRAGGEAVTVSEGASAAPAKDLVAQRR